MIQSGGFIGILLGPLLKVGLPLIKNVIKTLAKIVLIPLGLTVGTSAAHARIHKKILGSDKSPSILAKQTATLIVSNDEMEDIMKIVKSLDDSGLLLKRISEKIQNEVKKQKWGFSSMLLGTLSGRLSGNMLAGKRFIRAGYSCKGKKKLELVMEPGDL